MIQEDLEVDPNFETPGGKELPRLARNPHLYVDVIHSANSSTPEILVGSAIIELLPDNSETPTIFVELGLDPSKEYSITTSAYAGVIDINRAIGSTGVEVVASNNTEFPIVQTSIAVKAVEIL